MKRPHDTTVLVQPREMELVEKCGGWARIHCRHEGCGKVYTVPYLDSGKEIPCSGCGKNNRVGAAFMSFSCKCGRRYRLAAELRGLSLRCKHCNHTTEVTEKTTTAAGRPEGYIFFTCRAPDCEALLVQQEALAGRGMECPSCRGGIIVPEKSILDPIEKNISIREFKMPAVELPDSCPICGFPIAGECPLCADLAGEITAGSLLLQENQVLQYLKAPDTCTGVVLHLGEEMVDIADHNFHEAGALIRYAFLDGNGKTLGDGVFRVKSFSPFIEKRQIIRYRLEPLPNPEIWKPKRKLILKEVEGAMLNALFLAEGK